MITDSRHLWCLIVDVNFGLLRRVNAGSVADVSDIRAASIYMIEVCRLVRFCVCI
jgi:hypothetical protein